MQTKQKPQTTDTCIQRLIETCTDTNTDTNTHANTKNIKIFKHNKIYIKQMQYK